MWNELYYIRIAAGVICLLKIGAHILYEYFDKDIQDRIEMKGAAGIGGRYLFPIPLSKSVSKNRIIKLINTIYISSMIIYIISILVGTFWK